MIDDLRNLSLELKGSTKEDGKLVWKGGKSPKELEALRVCEFMKRAGDPKGLLERYNVALHARFAPAFQQEIEMHGWRVAQRKRRDRVRTTLTLAEAV